MIHKFGGCNCWSFKEWFEIDFTVSKSVKIEGLCFPATRNLPVLCFEGANASGKTSALKVVSFIYYFCLSSFYLKPDATIPFRSFFGSKEKSEFFLDFSLDDDVDNVFYYEVVFEDNHVAKEKLSVKNGKEKKKLLLSRKGNIILTCNITDIPSDAIYRDNVSFFSTLFQHGVKSMKKFEEFFSKFISNVCFNGVYPGVPFNIHEYYYQNPSKLKFVKENLKNFDTGIADISIQKELVEDKEIYFPLFFYKTIDGIKSLPYDCQSEGTKVLYQRMLDIYNILENGGIFCFDELDTKLHNDLVPILLDLFLNPSKNTNKSQLIFTSHNPVLMDYVKKYGTYIFEKVDNESFCYRCDEINTSIIRNDRNNLSKCFTDHAIGGYPKIEYKES